MYTLVLMAAMTAQADMPAFGRRCCGGCYGCYGCWGCHGCWGCRGCHGCWGCHGCYGCWGCYGCHGCHVVYHGCYGCYGCCACFGAPVYVQPAKPEAVPPPMKEEAKPPEIKDNAARLIFEVPEDAKLYIDDRLMQTPSARRTFRTPPLDPGQKYFYMVKVEVVRDGKTYSDTKRVILQAGQTVQESFAHVGKSDPNKALAAASK